MQEELVKDETLIIEKQRELFTAALVHDLKNPLNAQTISLEQLYKGKFGGITALQKEILESILNSSRFMLEMLSSLLDIYKFENGAPKLNKMPFDLDNIIKICIREMLPLSDERCIFIEYENKTENSILYCDERYIRRIITNMLYNTILYSYKNTKPVISLEDSFSNILIRFKSCGYPIDSGLKAHIFGKYSTGRNKNAGAGLGLYFCRKAIEAHGGSIMLNAQDSNIEFLIQLPRSLKSDGILKLD